ncbi:NLI interacting factor [Corchorus olitorius]|uniref:Mitochondrial import inner membrane translocase subunit TIM50 n=1 Tax=Corchorus olitorius TaxID=93759 RepID=A0A1R3HCZ8_9ROSI|nr:NLI interacting factor [Corchorus olitorius]
MVGSNNLNKHEFSYKVLKDGTGKIYYVLKLDSNRALRRPYAYISGLRYIIEGENSLQRRKKKLLILGLEGLLCHRICWKDRTQVPILHRRPDATYGSYSAYKRPYCEEFMKFCLERFEVGIWSSAREWYLTNTLDCIMSGLRSKLLVAWPHTVIFPTEYKAYHVNDNSLGPNGELRLYLEGLAAADDVPSYVKAHPFGKPAITPMHPDWDYYSKIVVSIEGTKLKNLDINRSRNFAKPRGQNLKVQLSYLKMDRDYSVHKIGKKKLLILGLGGLLSHRICRKDRTQVQTVHRRPDTAYGSYSVYKRPYCEEFMKFCLERFEVGIWSSAREWYLTNSLDCIMSGLRSKLLFAWDQNECTNTGFSTLEKKEKPIFLKELKKVWEINWSSSFQQRAEYSASNTLLIDDNPYKALLNPPHTAIFPTEYKAYHANDNSLGPNGDLRLYLEGLAAAEDVPSYVKAHPFGQSAITPLHPDWDYYSKIVVSKGQS